MDQQNDRHGVDIELGRTGAGAGAGEPRCCAVCTETLAWVSVGSCGHSLVVCPRCMARVRFVHGDRCCGVCGADCPSVIVAKAGDSTRGGGPIVPGLSQQPASTEGNVGEYWYHGDTAAYFHDEQKNEEAKDACEKTRPRYLLWFMFVVLFGGAIGVGAPFGYTIARDMKGTGMKVLGYALGMCITVPVACVFWCPFAWRCCDD